MHLSSSNSSSRSISIRSKMLISMISIMKKRTIHVRKDYNYDYPISSPVSSPGTRDVSSLGIGDGDEDKKGKRSFGHPAIFS